MALLAYACRQCIPKTKRYFTWKVLRYFHVWMVFRLCRLNSHALSLHSAHVHGFNANTSTGVGHLFARVDFDSRDLSIHKTLGISSLHCKADASRRIINKEIPLTSSLPAFAHFASLRLGLMDIVNQLGRAVMSKYTALYTYVGTPA